MSFKTFNELANDTEWTPITSICNLVGRALMSNEREFATISNLIKYKILLNGFAAAL